MRTCVVTVLGIVLVIACVAQAGAAKKKPVRKRQDSYHPKAQQLPFRYMGPFVNLPDGTVLGVDRRQSMISADEGKTWHKERDITRNSPLNHTYARRPVAAHPDFYAFWADGNPDTFSESRIYFTNQAGSQVWRLPVTMDSDLAEPEPLY